MGVTGKDRRESGERERSEEKMYSTIKTQKLKISSMKITYIQPNILLGFAL